MPDLTKNEELILLAIWKLKDNAYGVTIRKAVNESSDKILHYGSLYNTLDLLSRKDYVISHESVPVSQKGGRRKILYNLTSEGMNSLKCAQEYHQRVWGNIPDIILENE